MVGARTDRTARVRVMASDARGWTSREDEVVLEEPLEIRVRPFGAPVATSVAVTMRTPGNDFELAAGFLLGEGVLDRHDQIDRISYCPSPGSPQEFNVLEVRLAAHVPVDLTRLSRHVYTTSSCGVCGKGSIEQVRAAVPVLPRGAMRWTPEGLGELSGHLRRSQGLFARTGGLHAAGLFSPPGKLLLAREDVGRHNAVDKIGGALLLSGRIPAPETLLLLSGRASFELVQKAALFGIPTVASVGAPSSLAVSLAEGFGQTLIGFLREGRFNVYTGPERVVHEAPPEGIPHPGSEGP